MAGDSVLLPCHVPAKCPTCGKGVVEVTFFVRGSRGSYGCGVCFETDDDGPRVFDLRPHQTGTIEHDNYEAAQRSPRPAKWGM